MNRQQRRQAERKLSKGLFPFPDLTPWFREYLKKPDNAGLYLQIRDDGLLNTNLTGESVEIDVIELREILDEIKEQEELEHYEDIEGKEAVSL